MSSGHDNHDNHSTEPKEVSFRTPMILALVTVLAIVLLVSTCDKKHGCCEDGAKCEQEAGGHGTHETAGHENAVHEDHHADKHAEATTETVPVADSVSVTADSTAAKVEEHAAHH